jgi:hypothetical protein
MPDADLTARTLLRRSIELLRAHPFPLLLPPVLLSLLTGSGNARGGGSTGEPWNDPASFDPLPSLPFYALVATIVTVVIIAIVLAILIVGFLVVATALVWTTTARALLDHLETGARPDLTTAFSRVGPRWAKLGWTFFLALLLAIVGFIALIVPGFIVMTALLPLAAILAAERMTGREAIRRAFAITKGRKGQLSLLVVGGVLVEIIVGATIGWIAFFGWLVAGAVNGAVAAVWLASGVIVYRASTTPQSPPLTSL